MIFAQDRDELRKMYIGAWQKRCDHKPMTPLEAQIADVIAAHPEYHAAVAGEDQDKDYTPGGGEANPLLHMGLHLGLREQMATNRPAGIATLFRELAGSSGDAHGTEHRMIDCLAETLWEAQRQNRAPDETHYLQQLHQLRR